MADADIDYFNWHAESCENDTRDPAEF